MQELVSVIVPVYNVEKYIEKCIESIINQTYKNLEIFLVDDGSTDNSLNICKEYAEKDSRIIVLTQSNSGAYKARKYAVEIATGRYVAFVDGDDWIDSDMYADMVSIMEKYHTLMVGTGTIDVNGEKESVRKQKAKEGHYKDEVFVREILPYMLYDGDFFESLIEPTLWNKMFSREPLKEIFEEIEEGGKIANDVVITYPFLTRNHDIYITTKSYYHYRMIVSNSISRNRYKDIYDRLNVHIKNVDNYFRASKYRDILVPQLSAHCLRMYIMYCPEIFDSVPGEYLSIYGGVKKNEKIIIYGAGKSGANAYTYACNYIKDQIIAWVDKNYDVLSKTVNECICDPREADFSNVDRVIVTVLKADAIKSIKKDLSSMGVTEDKISWIPNKYIVNPKLAFELIEGRK